MSEPRYSKEQERHAWRDSRGEFIVTPTPKRFKVEILSNKQIIAERKENFLLTREMEVMGKRIQELRPRESPVKWK